MAANICSRCNKEKGLLRACDVCDKWYCNGCHTIHAFQCTGPEAEPEPETGGRTLVPNKMGVADPHPRLGMAPPPDAEPEEQEK